MAAQSGFFVTLVDLDVALLQNAEKSIKRNLARVAKKRFNDERSIENFVQESLARIKTSTNVAEAVKATDLVIEAIVEKLEAKQKLFALIDTVSRYFRFPVQSLEVRPFRLLRQQPSSPATLRPFRFRKLPKAQSDSTGSVAFTFSIPPLSWNSSK